MKASIIVSISNSNKILLENFLSNLSKCENINEYELILVNDDSDFVFNEKYVHSFNIKNVKVINVSPRKGYGIVNNLAIEYANSEIIIFMNDDVLPTINCLEILINDLKCNKCDAVQPKLIYPQTNTIQSTGHVFTNYTNSHAFENQSINSNVIYSDYRTALTTALCATRKDLFLKMGKFDPIYINAWEGMEYTLKLTTNGYKCYFDSNAEAYHIRGGTRSLFKLDETCQSAIFWSRWHNLITPDLHNFIVKQLDVSELNKDYIVLNFSKLVNEKEFLSKCKINVKEIISYSYNSGEPSIDFLKYLPTSLCSVDNNIIYLSNNFTQVIKNSLWFELRKSNQDLIIDLCGNIIRV